MARSLTFPVSVTAVLGNKWEVWVPFLSVHCVGVLIVCVTYSAIYCPVQNERAALEGLAVELTGKHVALERWITENESRAPQGSTASLFPWPPARWCLLPRQNDQPELGRFVLSEATPGKHVCVYCSLNGALIPPKV